MPIEAISSVNKHLLHSLYTGVRYFESGDAVFVVMGLGFSVTTRSLGPLDLEGIQTLVRRLPDLLFKL